jgi:hypothetical protein
MAYASISGRARTNAKSPRAHAICDRCGFRYNFIDLKWQHDYRGPVVANLRILVCPPCLDEINAQLRAIVLPIDPEPIINARVQDFEGAEANYRSLSRPTVYDPVTGIPIPDTTLRVTEDCQNRVVNPFGDPSGLIQNAVMPYNAAIQKQLGVPLSVLSVISNGTATVQVTCSAVHGLQSNGQVSIEGLSVRGANGFYSVTVLGATTFTYMTYGSIAAASLLTPTTRIITALVGLPRGYTQIPKINGPPLTVSAPPTEDFLFELEAANGAILLEDGTDFLELEDGP